MGTFFRTDVCNIIIIKRFIDKHTVIVIDDIAPTIFFHFSHAGFLWYEINIFYALAQTIHNRCF